MASIPRIPDMPDDYAPAMTVFNLEPGKIRIEARDGDHGLAAEVTAIDEVPKFFNAVRKSLWYARKVKDAAHV